MSLPWRLASGSAMVEMLVAILLMAMAVSAMVGALLSSQANFKRADRREQIALATNQLLNELRNYNAPFPPDPITLGVTPAPGDTPWHLPGDTCPGMAFPCWALLPGMHTADTFLPWELRQAPYLAQMTYSVAPMPLPPLPPNPAPMDAFHVVVSVTLNDD